MPFDWPNDRFLAGTWCRAAERDGAGCVENESFQASVEFRLKCGPLAS